MRGEETHVLLFAYLDQALEVVSHMEMADHLPTYPQCTRAYTAQQAMQSALRTAHALFHRRCFWQALRKVPCGAREMSQAAPLLAVGGHATNKTCAGHVSGLGGCKRRWCFK